MKDIEINSTIRAITGIQRDDFDRNLNAMHEAIFSLSQEDRVKWFNNLCEIVDMKKELALDAMSIFYLINSTARERAKAFLRTKGKWKE